MNTRLNTRLDAQLHENISALADGELAGSDIELACATLATPDGQVAWQAYYQIGAALRSQHCGAELSPDFASRLASRLATDSTFDQPADAAHPGFVGPVGSDRMNGDADDAHAADAIVSLS
jgi:sigma-E factor negative regulatory protein RseA